MMRRLRNWWCRLTGGHEVERTRVPVAPFVLRPLNYDIVCRCTRCGLTGVIKARYC